MSDSHAAISARIAKRYRQPSHRSYARGKLRWDPMFPVVGSLLVDSPRPLLDIGCGLGLLGQYLRASEFRAAYHGLDLDAAKIDAARDASTGLDLMFSSGSAAALPPGSGDVALLDVLHYLAPDAQRDVLAEAATRVASDGILVIRNVLRDDGWRFRITVAEEKFARAIGWMRCATGHFPRREEIETELDALGFVVQVEPLWGRTPFNSYLFVARRKPSRD